MENLNKFLSVIKKPNGTLKFKYDINEEANVYKWLKLKGFGRFKSDKKVIYFKRENEKIRKSSLLDMDDTFFDFIENGKYIINSNLLSREDILNFFYNPKNKPIKNNSLLAYYLKSDLNLNEIDEIEKT